MSQRYKDGSHYEDHQRADELQDGGAHAHRVGEQHGKQDHPTGREHSRQQIEHSPEAHEHSQTTTTGHGVIAFGHNEIAALAHELWKARGCPAGSADEDWFRAVEQLRAHALGHRSQ